MENGNSAHNIRFRILILTLLTISPIILFIIYLNDNQFNYAKNVEISQLNNTSKLFAAENEQIIEGARQLLISLSSDPQIKNPDINCSNNLLNTLNSYKRYNNLVLTDKFGNVICSANIIPQDKSINVSDRTFYKNAVENNDFSVGEYRISPTTNQPILTFGYPVYSPSGEFSGVIYATLNLSWLKSLVLNYSLAQNAEILILDRHGKILASNNNELKIGNTFPSKPLTDELGKGSGLIEEKSGTKQFISFNRIGSNPSGPFAVIAVTQSSVFQKPNQDFKNAVLILAIIIIFSILAGWLIGNSLITSLVVAVDKVDQLRRDFVSLVSHQLRTPLTAIKYSNEILLSGLSGKLNAKQKEFVTNSYTSANRLASMVAALLDVSRLESERMQLNLEKAYIKPLVNEAISEISILYKKKKLKVRIDEKKGVAVEILMDKRLIKQAVSNLISNAFKYSTPNSSINIVIRKKQEEMLLSVANQGIPIPKQDKPQIFSKFFRSVNAVRISEDGSGLGLYLSRLIIEAHNGRIWFNSSKKGTTFFFTLPIK